MMRLTTIPPPLNRFQRRCIDWGNCGICAIASKNSILLYSINILNNQISLLRVVEFSSCEIYALKFHNEEPLLAISRSTGLLIYDCEKGQTQSGIKIDEFSSPLIQVEWCGDVLICLSKGNILYGIQIMPNDQSNFSSSSYRRGSFTNTDLPKCKILWKIDLKFDFKGISIDHFHRCRILVYSKESTISFYQSDNPKLLPHFLFSYEFSKPIVSAQFHPQIADIVFILTNTSTILSFETQTKSVFYVIQEMTSGMRFEQLILPHQSYNKLYVICFDSTIISYETTDQVQFLKKYWNSSIIKSQHYKSFFSGKFVADQCFLLSSPLFDGMYLMYSRPIGLVLIKSTDLISNESIERPLLNSKEYYISLNKNTPHSISCFDCCEHYVGYGTNDGDIYIVDSIKAEIKYHFNFQERIIKFLFIDKNSFIWISLPQIPTGNLSSPSLGNLVNNSNLSSRESYDNLDGLNQVNQMFNAGYFNILNRTLTKFKNVTDIFSNHYYGVVQHGGFYFEIIKNSQLSKSNSIKKMFLQTEIVTCGIQIDDVTSLQSSSSFNHLLSSDTESALSKERHRAGSTLTRPAPLNSMIASKLIDKVRHECEPDLERSDSDNDFCKKGEKIVFITSKNLSLVIYDIATEKYIRKLQCPKEFKGAQGIKVTFTKNFIVLSSSDSRICLVNLKQASSRLISDQFKGIKKISFQEKCAKFAVLSGDNKLAVFDADLIDNIDNSVFCNHFVYDFAPCSKQMFLVQSLSHELKYLSEDLLLPIKQSASSELVILPSKVERLNNVILSIENKQKSLRDNEFKASDYKFIFECNFFQFESLIWEIVDKYFQSIEADQEAGHDENDNESSQSEIDSEKSQNKSDSENESNKEKVCKLKLQLKYYQYGDEQEYQSLTTFRSSLIQNDSPNYDSSLYQLLTAIRCHNVSKMRQAILSSSQNLFGVLAASLIDSKISPSSASFLEKTGMEYFEKGKNLEATIIMELIGNRLKAASFLQSKNMWNASLEILVSMKKNKEAKKLIRAAAFHYLEINETKKAILLFISIGDFYPALSMLKSADLNVFAYYLLKFVEKKTQIETFELPKTNFCFEPLESLKEEIVNAYNDFLN